MMLRIDGFKAILEKVLKTPNDGPDPSNLYTSLRYMIREAFDQNPGLRGGFM